MRALALVLACAAPAAAHDLSVPPPAPVAQGIALPLNLGGPFSLVDQHGQTRTEVDPDGHLQLLFFGYAACESICTFALPQMAEIAQGLRDLGIPLLPVMITVDPFRDTPEVMAKTLGAIAPEFVGLTGPDAALQATYAAFGVENTVVFTDPAGQPVYAHGSLLYLLDGEGQFLTIIPPILTSDRAVEIIAAFGKPGQ